MGGMSVPSGFFGGSGLSGASTAGFVGGQMNPNTTAAVSDAAGKLTAYDPAAMAMTTAPKEAPDPTILSAGYDSSGLPSWQTNWLQSGGKEALKAPVAGLTGANATSKAGELFKPKQPPKPVPPPVPKSAATGVGAPAGVGAPTAVAAPATGAQGGMKFIPPTYAPQQYAVGDFYNGNQGGSHVGTIPVNSIGQIGPAAHEQQTPGYYVDSKGNMFYDAAGLKPYKPGMGGKAVGVP